MKEGRRGTGGGEEDEEGQKEGRATLPSDLGFSIPPEWARHHSTWLSWPKNPLTFPPDILPRVEMAYVRMVEELTRGERVDLLVDDEKTEDRVRSMLSKGNVSFHRIRSADVWMRDYGPIFVRRGAGTRSREAEVAATKWEFNAWGNKYDDLLPDDETGREVAMSTGLAVFETGVVLEGGSIDTNGEGTLLTTRQCLLNKNRNPRLGEREIEQLLQRYLGVEKVVWLGNGVAGDDTDGHVDDIARFVSKSTVVCMNEPDEGDVNHAALKQNQELLSRSTTSEGVPLEIVSIDMPRKVVVVESNDEEGKEEGEGRLPASYANFYVGNAAVLVPVFQDEKRDDSAVETLSRFFKGRRIVPIDCRDLVYGFGGIHCVTQQQPSD
jgi:agmatine deiminase